MAKVSPTNAFRARLLAILRELSFEEAITALIELATRKPVRSVFPIVSGSRSIQVRGIEKLISDGGVTRKNQEQIIKNLIEDAINKQVEKRVAQECTKDPLPSSESSEAMEGKK